LVRKDFKLSQHSETPRQLATQASARIVFIEFLS
jgi:hypothetical protein